jgi:L-asparaginase
VLLAHAGGTIGMRPTPDGYAPDAGFLAQQLASVTELSHPSLPSFDLVEYDPLLDSSNMRPQDWLRIAGDIAERASRYDGSVVLHGTDTMAYTASALAFLLEGLGKPVVVTGSQIPLGEVRTDARDNLITSMMIAGADRPLPEVVLCFGGKVLRGCRATKVDADAFDAFASPNYPALGGAGVELSIRWDLVRAASTASVKLLQEPDVAVAALRLFPGISAEVVRNVTRPPLRGLILEAYGAGNAPDRDPELLSAIADAVGAGIVVVDCTQCLRGSVELDLYATGAALARAGVVGGFDMTVEAALTKLWHLLGSGHSPAATRELMVRDLCGELTR